MTPLLFATALSSPQLIVAPRPLTRVPPVRNVLRAKARSRFADPIPTGRRLRHRRSFPQRPHLLSPGLFAAAHDRKTGIR